MPLNSGGKLCDKHRNNIAKTPFQSTKQDKTQYPNNNLYYMILYDYLRLQWKLVQHVGGSFQDRSVTIHQLQYCSHKIHTKFLNKNRTYILAETDNNARHSSM